MYLEASRLAVPASTGGVQGLRDDGTQAAARFGQSKGSGA